MTDTPEIPQPDSLSHPAQSLCRGSVLDLIGNTPLVRLRNLVTPGSADVFGKCEHLNPGGSVKDRIAKAMVEAAEEAGHLRKGSVIVEPTSGNTGIGLAIAAATKGYGCVLAMPEDMSIERRRLLEAYGAELMLTPQSDGMYTAVEFAAELCASDDRYFMPMQFSNPANPRAHELGTGPEIIAALAPRPVDAFVCGVGTGGTITGVGKTLRAHFPDVQLIAVEPENSPVLSGGQPGVHGIQGIGAGFVPEVLDVDLVTDVITVSEATAHRTRKLLAVREGIHVGISAGAAVFAAMRVAESLGPGKTVVTILCDTGERYLSLDA